MQKDVETIPTGRFRELRVGLSEFKGHDMVAVRQWVTPYSGQEDERVPSKNGVNFQLKHLPAVIAALQEAEATARTAGLLTSEEEAA